MTLTKQEITDLLNLNNPNQIGHLLHELTGCYTACGHKKFNSDSQLPDFLKRAFGPALERLPSFTTKRSEKRSVEDQLAPRTKESGIRGIGAAMEAMHSDMRLLGSKVGRLFFPAMQGVVSIEEMTKTSFNPQTVEKLKDIKVAYLTLSPNIPPLKIEENPDEKDKKKKNIVYKAFMIGAEARAHNARTEPEQEALKSSVGTLMGSYTSLRNLQNIIEEAMRKDPNYAGKSLSDFGLAPNVDKIAAAFAECQQEFCTLYNYLYIIELGAMHQDLCKFKRAADKRQGSFPGIIIETPQDAAAAIAALYEICRAENEPRKTMLFEQIARSTPAKAAMLIEKEQVIPQIDHMSYRGSTSKGESMKVQFIRPQLDLLERFVKRNLPAPDLAAIARVNQLPQPDQLSP